MDIAQTLIWRNALNKYFSFGICGGTHAWACSNLMMAEDFIEFRRHTKGMDENELKMIAERGITNIFPKLTELENWHESLQFIKLSETETRAFAYKAINQGIISKQKITEFDNILFSENHEYDPLTLFGFHGACTQLMREQSMTGSFVQKQKNLYQFTDDILEQSVLN